MLPYEATGYRPSPGQAYDPGRLPAYDPSTADTGLLPGIPSHK